jgi:hypothetical protein
MRPEAAHAWLVARRADRIPHSGRNLLAQLAGTRALLDAAGQPRHVCAAGLFHSVYGTNAFRTAIARGEDRAELQALIGEAAEALAWAFGHIDRPRLLVLGLHPGGRATALAQLRTHLPGAGPDLQSVLGELAVVEAANLLEQGQLCDVPELAPVARAAGLLSAAGFSPHFH